MQRAWADRGLCPRPPRLPLVVTDDDVAGTFTFIRALEDHGAKPDSHVARDRRDLAQLHRRAPRHPVVGRQRQFDRAHRLAQPEARRRGAGERLDRGQRQDGRRADRRADLHRRLGDRRRRAIRRSPRASPSRRRSVSHDGEAVDAAKLWAAMEAEAFVSRDVEHLIDVGLAQIPASSPIARLVADMREWRSAISGLARRAPGDRGALRLRQISRQLPCRAQSCADDHGPRSMRRTIFRGRRPSSAPRAGTPTATPAMSAA